MAFSINNCGGLNIHRHKNEPQYKPHVLHKNQFKLTGLDVKQKTITSLEKTNNIRENLQCPGLNKEFL